MLSSSLSLDKRELLTSGFFHLGCKKLIRLASGFTIELLSSSSSSSSTTSPVLRLPLCHTNDDMSIVAKVSPSIDIDIRLKKMALTLDKNSLMIMINTLMQYSNNNNTNTNTNDDNNDYNDLPKHTIKTLKWLYEHLNDNNDDNNDDTNNDDMNTDTFVAIIDLIKRYRFAQVSSSSSSSS